MTVSMLQLEQLHAENPSPELSTLQHAAAYPCDSGDDEYNDTAPDSVDWAHAAARGVVADLKGRRQIKWSFEDIDHEIRIEIVGTLAGIIRKAHEVAA